MSNTRLVHMYRTPALSEYQTDVLLKNTETAMPSVISDIETEHCFNIETTEPLSGSDLNTLTWLLSETFEKELFSTSSFLATDTESAITIEVGPRMNFSTAWSTNAVSICRACGLKKITRIERSRRYRVLLNKDMACFDRQAFLALVHDRMTECEYKNRLITFETGIVPESVFTVPLIEDGKDALRKLNTKMGLGLDDWDVDYYYNLFVNDLKRNPTNVECFDLSQSNSEHSRHWFFTGKIVIDGKELDKSLMKIVKEPYLKNKNNSVIAFHDNSSAIEGFRIKTLIPQKPGSPSKFDEKDTFYHLIFTAETHNFPSGVAPFPGAETGTGGRIRDVHATGRGSLVVAGTAAYCVGNLRIPGYEQPWEDMTFEYPTNLASPLQIEIDASNGASDYGNKFGEPLIQGFTRAFGLRLPDGERREWLKPIMFTAGVGQIDASHIEKGGPEKGMVVVKLGGPAYRIGMGGGAASSMIQGENVAELDFNAVQRGDAEMEQKVNRVIRACVEMAGANPIISIHDQGAGGNCNVVKEIIYPAGAKINIRDILVGDNTLSVLEIWGAEYQEQDALLLSSDKVSLFATLCQREKVPFSVIGDITGDGYIVLFDRLDNSTPENLDLKKVLGEMPKKTFTMQRAEPELKPLVLPDGITIKDALNRVLRLVSVGSKRFLTNKVDRSVTGLIARQQCAGPLQLTVSDVAVIAQSHFSNTGAAISIGEQPIKGLIDPAAMARMSVAEAVTNIVWAKITKIEDIRCSGNWMWAPKLPGEGARLYDAAVAMSDLMCELGIAIDGGKDSLSMAAKVTGKTTDELVKSPGTLVISAYAPCPDITKTITPYIKAAGNDLIFIDLAGSKNRLGGSALAQCYSQVGSETPDIEDSSALKNAFATIQNLIDKGLILSGHDRSDGGLITTLLEMAFAGNCGLDLNISAKDASSIEYLFSEESGLVIECSPKDTDNIISVFTKQGIPVAAVGKSSANNNIKISFNGKDELNEDMRALRAVWEETSYQLEKLQANPACVEEEKKNIYDRSGQTFRTSFSPEPTPEIILKKGAKPSVAVIREEGSNGDREMCSAFYQAGFDVFDVTMSDLLDERIELDQFRGAVFVGGFSYADVMDSAKGWAGTIRFNTRLQDKFNGFYNRPDTFSLGVCNGCQLMALLGWVPWEGIEDAKQPRFIHNKSGRFESRFSSLRILQSPSIMLKDMEESVLGVWIAHGEGFAHFPDNKILVDLLEKNLAPVRYADDLGNITEAYPFNPNGSPQGIAGLCSPDGRHLAMMPHPERAFLKWQWPWMPENMKRELAASPWLRMFQNARQWCENN
ncbi:MAG: phosphoribosylformylglycinamidine synthase [Nitrospirae bacterium]|nr:phosphoribosylformylglycinamidine synthase [Nitrospirota bacterium]